MINTDRLRQLAHCAADGKHVELGPNLRIAELTAALRECLDEIRECDDMTGVRARAISALGKEGVK